MRHLGIPCSISFRTGARRRSIPCTPYLHWLLWRWCSQMLDPLHSLHRLLMRWCSQMPDPLHSLQSLLRRWCSHMLSIRFSSFLLLVARSPVVASPAGVLMRGDSRWLACISPPGNVGSDGFSFCRLPCTGLPQLLMSCTLVCSVRCRFIAPSLLSGLARFSVDTVPWLGALSPFHTSIRIRVCTASCSVNES